MVFKLKLSPSDNLSEFFFVLNEYFKSKPRLQKKCSFGKHEASLQILADGPIDD